VTQRLPWPIHQKPPLDAPATGSQRPESFGSLGRDNFGVVHDDLLTPLLGPPIIFSLAALFLRINFFPVKRTDDLLTSPDDAPPAGVALFIGRPTDETAADVQYTFSFAVS
jgi:hypothetical protein